MRSHGVGLVIVGLVIAGCGGSSSSGGASAPPKPVVNHAAVDEAISQSISGIHTLTHLHGSIYDEMAQYKEANGDFGAALAVLSPPPAGIPVGDVTTARGELTSFRASLTALTQCFEHAVRVSASASSCNGAAAALNSRANSAGQAVGVLAVYGSVPVSTVQQRVSDAAG